MVETANIYDLLGDNDEVEIQPKAVALKAAPGKTNEVEKPGKFPFHSLYLQMERCCSVFTSNARYSSLLCMVCVAVIPTH